MIKVCNYTLKNVCFSEKEIVYESVPEKLEECRQLIASVLPEINVDFGNNMVLFNQDLKAKL